MDNQAGVYNYYYDYNGNLIGDVAEKLTNISWTVYGKIASIVKNGATISYSYDAAGNRITKTAGGITTLYVRDASGNVMSVYELPAAEQLVQKEVHLYGSSRIGIVKVDNEVVEQIPLAGGGEIVIRKFTRGNKFFETTNHLGNVLATVTDRKLLQSSTEQAGINNGGCQPGTAVEELTVMQRGTASQFTARAAVYLEAGFETVDVVDELEVNTSTQQTNCVALPPATISNGQAWYVADVVSATDYAPFGMALVGRSYSSEKYRYGFNGKENDNEVKGAGNQQDYGMRIYDPRLGRFLSVDPLAPEYPWYTPYQYAGNKPIKFIDLDGLEEATPEERQRSQSYFESSLKPYIAKYASKRAFVNINPKTFATDLGAVLKDPGTLKKRKDGVGNFCGVYAFSYIYALYEPTKFAQGAADLYITGQAHDIGGLDVTAESDLKEAKEADFDSHSLSVLVFRGSLRSHYNASGGYPSKYFGSTGSGTMKAWLTDRLNVKVTEFSYGHERFGDGITSSDLSTLIDHINSGKQALVRLSFNQYSSGSDATKSQGKESAMFAAGDHWAVFTGSMSLSKDKKSITFQAFDMNEGLKTKTMDADVFKNMINHVLMVEKKPAQ